MNLIDAMTVEFTNSKRWLSLALCASCALYAITLVGIFGSGWVSKGVAIGVFVLQLLAFLFRFLMGRSYSSGEKIRRLAMLKDALGIEPTAHDITTIATRLGFPDATGRSFVGEYYASTVPTGQQRLLQILDECAYWTAQGAAVTRNYLGFGLGAALCIVIVAVLVSLQTGLSSDQVAKVFISTFGFIAVGDLASMFFKFHSLTKSANDVLSHCSSLAKAPQIDDKTLIEAGEYNCAVASAGTPIPNWVYKRNQSHWNSVYDARRTSLFGDRERSDAESRTAVPTGR